MPVQASGIVIAGVTALAIYGSYKLPEKAGNGGEEAVRDRSASHEPIAAAGVGLEIGRIKESSTSVDGCTLDMRSVEI